MKTNILLICIGLILLSCIDKVEAQKDSLLVIYNYVYNTDSEGKVINNSRYCPLQQTFNSDGKLVRELVFHKDKKTSQIITDAFRYYFYQNNLLQTIESYTSMGEIFEISTHKYNNENKLLKKDVYKIDGTSVIKKSRQKYKYKDAVLINEKDYEKKLINVITINKSADSVVYKKVFSKKSLKDTVSVKKVEYFNNNLLSKKLVITAYKDDSISIIEHQYTYNKNNHLQEAIMTKNGEIQEKKYYMTYPDGSIKNISVLNSSGSKKIRFIAIDKKTMYRDPDIKVSVANNYF